MPESSSPVTPDLAAARTEAERLNDRFVTVDTQRLGSHDAEVVDSVVHELLLLVTWLATALEAAIAAPALSNGGWPAQQRRIAAKIAERYEQEAP